MPKHVQIDCGANQGVVLAAAVAALPGFEHVAFEANEQLIPNLRALAHRLRPAIVDVRHAAVWTSDGHIDLFLTDPRQDRYREGATLVQGKTTYGVDYTSPTRVPSIDLHRFIIEDLADADRIYLKVDIEGAEYDVLERMLNQGSMPSIDALILETHAHKVTSISQERHQALLRHLNESFGSAAAQSGTFVAWGRDAIASEHARLALVRDTRTLAGAV